MLKGIARMVGGVLRVLAGSSPLLGFPGLLPLLPGAAGVQAHWVVAILSSICMPVLSLLLGEQAAILPTGRH